MSSVRELDGVAAKAKVAFQSFPFRDPEELPGDGLDDDP
jgi:hypothetical protein